MKKSISLAMALLTALSFASCGHIHEYSSDWKQNETHHWHEATCNHSEEKGSYGEHVDLNNDGVCDDCQYTDSTHVHTYATQWSANATHHWHATDCGHSLVEGKAQHTADALGNCTVCGAVVSAPDVSTVEKAVAVGVLAGDKVSSGKITQSSKTMEYDWVDANENDIIDDGEETPAGYRDGVVYYIDYDVAEDYAHIVKKWFDSANYVLAYSENWYSKYEANGEEKVFGVKRYEYGGTITRDMYEMVVGMEEGYAFELLDGYYGVENLVSGLYELGAEEANNEMTASEENGVYTFTFEYLATSIYEISVSFELGAEYNFSNVTVNVNRWYAPTVTGEGADAVYSIPQVEVETDVWENADADVVSVYTIAQVAGESFAKENASEELLADSFKLMKGTEEVTEATTLTTVAGEYLTLSIADVLPETAMLKLDTLEVTVEDAEGNELDSNFVYTSTSTYSGSVTITAYKAFENAVVTVSSGKVTKTFKLTATLPAVTSIVASTSTTAEMYLGKTYSFYVVTKPTYADKAYTASIKSKPTESTTASLVLEQSTGKEVFTPDVLGEYVIEFTSVADTTKKAELTITVNQKPDLTLKFTGQYSVGSEGMNHLILTFTPDTDAKTGSIVAVYDGYVGYGDKVEYEETLTYSYDATTDAITLTHVSGDEGVLNSITFDANFDMKAVYVGGNMGTLSVYTPPQPIEEIAGEYSYYASEEWPTPEGNLRYSLTLNEDGTATLVKATFDGDLYGSYGGYVMEESVSFKVEVTKSGDVYTIDVTEITDGSVTGFSVDTTPVFSVEEKYNANWNEYYDVNTITVTLDGTAYAMGM